MSKHTCICNIHVYVCNMYLMNGFKVRDEHVSVIVAPLALNDGHNPLQSHSSVDVLLRENFKLTTRLPEAGE